MTLKRLGLGMGLLIFGGISGGPAQGDDALLTDAVLARLGMDRVFQPEDVRVRVEDETVTISGPVPDLAAATLAQTRAEEVRGVRRVRLEMSARLLGRTDEELRASAREVLEQDPAFAGLELQTEIRKAAIRVRGQVASLALRSAVENSLRAIAGAQSVDVSDVRIAPAPSAWARIERAVRDALGRDRRLTFARISVRVLGGVARLTGQVRDAAARARALTVAGLPGVGRVDATLLTVHPDLSSPRLPAPNTPLARSETRPRGPELSATEERAEADRLREAVIATENLDPRIGAFSPQATVRDGVVTLRGAVPSIAIREAAEDVAWQVAGIAGVVNELEVRRPGPPDADLALAIHRSLRARLSPQERLALELGVRAGAVVVAGTLAEPYAVRRLRDSITRVPGVTGVELRVRVPAQKAASVLRDQELRRRIALGLEWDGRIQDAATVDCTVVGGQATLTGTVATLTELLAAERLARHAGAQDIRNELRVSPAQKRTPIAMVNP